MEFAPKSSESSPGSVTETSAETGVDTKKAAAQTIKTRTYKQCLRLVLFKGILVLIFRACVLMVNSLSQSRDFSSFLRKHFDAFRTKISAKLS